MALTAYQERRVRELRSRNVGYRSIAAELGIGRDAVRYYCVSHGLNSAGGASARANLCPCCGAEIVQPQRGRPRKFCSDACCRKWWSAHPDAIRQSPEAQRRLTCAYCGKTFIAYSAPRRRYCSHNCYIRDRFWSVEEGRKPYIAPRPGMKTV